MINLTHRQITRNHHPRGIFREQFELVIGVILKYLGAALGDHLSPEGGAAWEKLFNAFLDVAEAELKELESHVVFENE